ncbi:hypothetical protein K7711_30345 [Nocardia sp. CA2R105]|uniref:hypothetical protein n=1 Tax=Nocardia coffeae TaxID=2873381 RepID=UPI001CA7A690|nr:hypothetical protein [Nocardia coffeae]MBY8860809.1 hypothetical protein [Nocardia coffeae]
MSLDVNPDSLRQAAAAMALLPQEIDKAAMPKTDAVANALKGSAVGGALDGLETATKTAKAVLEARFNEFSGLLALSADQYKDSDLATAKRLSQVTDLYQGNDPNNPVAALPVYKTGK